MEDSSRDSNDILKQVIPKDVLLKMLKEFDPSITLEDTAQDALISLGEVIVESTIQSAFDVAKARNSTHLTLKDVAYILEKDFGIYVPENAEKGPARTPRYTTHNERLHLIRKSKKR